MKSIVALSLPLLASAAVINHDKRQLFGAFIDYLAGAPNKPVVSKKLNPELEKTATREKLVWGPYKMSAANGTHISGAPIGIKLDPASDTFAGILDGICTDCMVTSALMEVSDKAGQRLDVADGIYTHHFIAVDVGRYQLPNPVDEPCKKPIKLPQVPYPGDAEPNTFMSFMEKIIPAVSVFVGKGEEAAPAVFSALNTTVKSGFYIAKGEKIYMTAEAVNYKNENREVYVSLDYEYIKPNNGKKPAGFMDVGSGSINIEGCMADLALDPPRDRPITYKSPEWRVTHNGYLINISPHVHDGALNIQLFLNGKNVCKSDIIYGGAGGGTEVGGQKWETINSFTLCRDPVKIKKGDILTMTSDYDLTKHKLRPQSINHDMGAEGMAMANFIFAMAPDQTAAWTG